MIDSIDGFDWDEGNWPKCGKHGVSREEIENLFFSNPLFLEDPYPHEKRTRAIGKTFTGRHIFVVFLLRHVADKILIRPVSARYMHEREKERYERVRI